MAKHPNIIELQFVHKVYDNITHFETAVIVLILMELCDGNLWSLIEKKGPLTLEECKKWFVQIINALSYVDSIGIS
jgi:serine/threonine protein kinase